ncbi:GNAT family N-acetyltransferase [Arthrobacter sp. 35W]|uniref:GNAT family N-acetyltransferase n=1 Tax=Arthrobacter sp. 35W TaxID=1132441 RepID=UPI0003F5AC3B|nr:GNAT family N-acetyltransferase [Arthrobacter sp. 35W]
MTTIEIEQLHVPQSLDGPDAADLHAAVEVSRQVRVNTWGNDDLAYTAAELLATFQDPYEWNIVLLARVEGEIVGRAGITLPLADSTDLAHVTLDILPSAQGHGVGRELLEAAEQFVLGENRRVVLVETHHPAVTLDSLDGETLQASGGVGHLPLSSREARFAHSAGYQLQQVEQFSARTLPLPEPLAESMRARALAAQGDQYILHQWVDRCPETWLADIVTLESSVAAVAGDDGSSDDAWTEARIRESEELAAEGGRHTLVSAAEDSLTGKLIGFTSISVLGNRDDVAFQDDTVVLTEHRGREVGLLIKVANLRLLAQSFPSVRTVYTWNASDNTYMLGVNAMLGFIPAGVTGQWHKDFNYGH